MKFEELVKKRKSVRSYLDTPVEKEKLMKCLEAARLAPSACNSQPWKYIVVDEPELKEKVAKLTTSKMVNINKFTNQAPVLLIIVTEKQNFTARFGQVVKDKQFNLMDIGMSVMQLCLQAAELGLGTCILGWFKENKVKELLNIPKKKRVELIITLGYPKDDNKVKKSRKDMDEIVSMNKY